MQKRYDYFMKIVHPDSLQLFWDADGNLAQIEDCKSGRTRLHRWNDFDRLTFSLGHDFCGKTRGDPKNLLIIGDEGKMRVASGCRASALR